MRCPLLIACLTCFLVAADGRAYTFQSVPLYHSYNDLASWAYGLQNDNPGLVNVVQFGTSVDGRPLLAINITVNPKANDPSKPEFLFTAGIHARELVTSEAARSLAESLVNGYGSGDSQYVNILSTRDVWIIPDQNPDGRIAFEGGLNDQRKNWHLYEGQWPNDATRGVDLNRNYPHQWELASAVPGSEQYPGPDVLSEPESSSLWNLLHDTNRFSNLTASIDFHSGAQTILTPWISRTEFDADPLPETDRAKFDFSANTLQDMTGLSTARLAYDSWGTLGDSLYEEFGTYSIIEEIYMGQSLDYFALFNPVTASMRDAVIDRAVQSAMFFLSDEAFVVPEPATLLLLILAGLLLLARRMVRTES